MSERYNPIARLLDAGTYGQPIRLSEEETAIIVEHLGGALGVAADQIEAAYELCDDLNRARRREEEQQGRQEAQVVQEAQERMRRRRTERMHSSESEHADD